MIYGIYPKHLNKTALIAASCFNNTEIIKLLLAQERIDINIQDILS